MNGSWLAGDIFQRLRDHLTGKTHQKKKEKRPTKKEKKEPPKEREKDHKKRRKIDPPKKGQKDQQKIDFDFGKIIWII